MVKVGMIGIQSTICLFGYVNLPLLKYRTFYKEEEEAIKNKGKKGSQTVVGADGQIKSPEFMQKPNNPSTPKPFPTKRPVSYK
jgi:hypothetical protein